jgi:hypothetical protein
MRIESAVQWMIESRSRRRLVHRCLVRVLFTHGVVSLTTSTSCYEEQDLSIYFVCLREEDLIVQDPKLEVLFIRHPPPTKNHVFQLWTPASIVAL